MKKAKKIKAKKKPAPKKKITKSKRRVVAKKKVVVKVKETKPIGAVTHFFSGIKVAIIKFKKPVKVGANIRISGATTDFTQRIASMQFEHESIKVAKKGKSVGVKVSKKVREGDEVREVK